MIKYRITSLRAGFGVTLLPKEVGGNVLKYYLEPEIQMQVPAEVETEEQLQEVLDRVGDEILSMIQNTIKKKIHLDKNKKKVTENIGGTNG